MKYFLYILLALTITFTSCDGRKSQHKFLTESVENYNKRNEIIITNYIPEVYLEREVDTTLSNGFKVKIITKANMSDSVILFEEKNNIKYSTNYRQFKFSIDVENNEQQIYSKTFDKEKVIEAISRLDNFEAKALPKDFDKLSVLKSIQLNEELSIEKNSVYIDIAYAIPSK
ncbi:MAG: hypothetical protein HKP48_07600 [Winogradskyella sp.]|uniref:hypothetical protein n=1 Tax=Winogradskyella sp. TaxID=1883156 RepID=UPI0018344652|nr:hypothetical protein [Winogradskyella sp.]MBT8244611.1 hypothetical protein [Winogradskyella sp.]NNK23147.1 hypothetical protein [Winogradskyella sp.]